jgi:hypothetical protein
MLHYSQARGPVEKTLQGLIQWATLSVNPRDPRVSVYRTEGEMQAQLQRAKDSNNLPVIFLSPGHAATINDYNPETKRADYDNQWGKSLDFLGKKALNTSELFKLGATIEPQPIQTGQKVVSEALFLEVIKDARKQYEDWCTASSVAPDSRYPTREEFSKWSVKTQPKAAR